MQEVSWRVFIGKVPCKVIRHWGIHWYYNGGLTVAHVHLDGHKRGGEFIARPPSGQEWNAPYLELRFITEEDAKTIAEYCGKKFKVRDAK